MTATAAGPLFTLGQVLATPGALGLGVNLLPYLERHVSGDWSEMTDHDRTANAIALRAGLRIFSAYQTPAGKLWIITEADRSATTFLLPEDY